MISLGDNQSKSWRLSFINDYPFYFDVVYNKNVFWGRSQLKFKDRIMYSLEPVFIPNISLNYTDWLTDFTFTFEGRLTPNVNLFYGQGNFPKPIARTEYATNFYVGKLIKHQQWQHFVSLGLGGRHLKTFSIVSPDQDLFPIPQNENELGAGVKYEITRQIGQDEFFELGLGISQWFYQSEVHVLNFGLVTAFKFGKWQPNYFQIEQQFHKGDFLDLVSVLPKAVRPVLPLNVLSLKYKSYEIWFVMWQKMKDVQ